ncbi:MRG/MORF4L-binding protein-like [Styela clava]|uniref:MRG/MORF4L-binding protein-like n=1 Tax=Styela clava TaxID=7725 RepID=UPI00193AB58E|nr:MRG/MORF4L-binding protein-like [Styela clava]
MGEIIERPSVSPILWNADTEVCLFYAMRGHKPVGINKHFHMMGIHSKFAQSLGQPVTSAQIWEHLSTMYNLAVLDESDALPFNNNVKHFQLPEDILNFGKDKTKKEQHEAAVKTPSTAKSSSNKDLQLQSKSTPPSAKSNRKRTRNVTSVSPAVGASGPGSSKRRR